MNIGIFRHVKIRHVAMTGAALSVMAMPFVAKWEGLRLRAYADPVGIPTICYGHTLDVRLDQVMTIQECNRLLEQELGTYLALVDEFVTIPLTDRRRVALASFAYNVGAENFKRSTLLKKLNAGNVIDACKELDRWVYAKGRKLPGLVNRRAAEKGLCLDGENVGS